MGVEIAAMRYSGATQKMPQQSPDPALRWVVSRSFFPGSSMPVDATEVTLVCPPAMAPLHTHTA